jgi:sensor histidine kinase YesM
MQVNAGDGVGLSNVKERLVALYGENSKLTLQENYPTGLIATVEVPHAAS